ncbi:hypothetical protein P5V15_007011 [Pogonomyrmex californicus]
MKILKLILYICIIITCKYMNKCEISISQKYGETQKMASSLQLENYEPTKSVAVCSVHFKNTDYELNYANHKLKKDALLKEEIQSAVQINLDGQNTSIEKTLIMKLVSTNKYIFIMNTKKTQKKLITLKNVLKKAFLQKRNLLTVEESDILQYLNEGTRELIKREIRKRKNLPISSVSI